MKLNNFSGGLSTRLDPTLIPPNEALVFTNIDNAKGNLTSIKNFLSLNTPMDRWFYQFKDKWYSSIIDREYLEYGDKLFFTEKENAMKKVVNDVVKQVGIQAPTEALIYSSELEWSPSAVTFAPSADYAAIAGFAAGQLLFYKMNLGTLVPLTAPADLPLSGVTGLDFDSTNTYLAVSTVSAPYVMVYKRTGDTFAKLANPAVTPTGKATGVSWGAGTHLAVSHEVTPFMTVYSFAADTLTKLSNPASLPNGDGLGVAFTADTSYVILAHKVAPYAAFYSLVGSTLTKQAEPNYPLLTESTCVAVSPDMTTVSFGLAAWPYIAHFWNAGAGVFNRFDEVENAVLGKVTSVSFNTLSTYITFTHEAPPYVTRYKHASLYSFVKMADPAVALNGIASSAAASKDSTYLAVAYATAPYIAVYGGLTDTLENFPTVTTVQHTYTYYDSSEGIESAPAPLSNEFQLAAGAPAVLSNFKPSENPAVDLIRLYRIGADTTDFTLLIELPANTTTYEDKIDTLDAIGEILESYNSLPPPVGLRYIVEAYGILFGILGDKVYYTEIGKPDSWPATNFIKLPKDGTGLTAVSEGILIFTSTKGYVLSGTTEDTFRLSTFSPEHGCTNHNSIKVIKNTVVWTSFDGICALSGNSIYVITKEKLDKATFNVISAEVYNEQYYIVLDDSTLFIYDLRFGNCLKKHVYQDSLVYNVGLFSGKLYAIVDESLALLDAGAPIEFAYLSPRLTEEDASVTKLYNVAYVKAEGRFRIDILIDGVIVAHHEIIGDDIFELTVPQEKQRGSDIQFDVKGIGTVKEIEYKIVGRENGR